MTLQDVLEDEGYSTVVAANGREALERLRALTPPCLILLDLMMPVMSGREFLAALREDGVLAPIPVVVVTAWPTEAQATPGVQGFVKKPIDVEVLLDLVRRYC